MTLRFWKWVFGVSLFTAANLAAVGAGHSLGPGAEAAADEHFLPLTPGTYWVYTGTVTSSDTRCDPVREISTNVSITTRVEKVFQKQGLTVAVISGYPGDLDWSNGQVEPKPSLLIETRKHEVFLNAVPPDFDYGKLEKDADSVQKLTPPENLLFRWPLKQGMKFGDAESMNREDGMYCWAVMELHKKKLAGIEGISPREAEVFLLRFATNPDDTELEVSSGIGILGYEYHHHGTAADTSVHLTEFHAGENGPAAP